MRRRQLFHRTGALHSLESVKGGAGQGFEGTGKVSVLRAWNGPGDAGKAVARLRECAGAVWEASFRYRKFVAEGVTLGRRPELVGGGLARSAGEWFAVRSQRPRRARELSDERILGIGEFVERILREADARALRQHAAKKRNRYAERVVAEECKKSGVLLTELRSGSHRGRLPAVRTKIVRGLVENYGVGVAEVARQVGISTSAVSKILTRILSN
jgi:hypothetical protein